MLICEPDSVTRPLPETSVWPVGSKGVASTGKARAAAKAVNAGRAATPAARNPLGTVALRLRLRPSSLVTQKQPRAWFQRTE
ncbi:hypothetical protein D3C85_1739590 [compost metagenome]